MLFSFRIRLIRVMSVSTIASSSRSWSRPWLLLNRFGTLLSWFWSLTVFNILTIYDTFWIWYKKIMNFFWPFNQPLDRTHVDHRWWRGQQRGPQLQGRCSDRSRSSYQRCPTRSASNHGEVHGQLQDHSLHKLNLQGQCSVLCTPQPCLLMSSVSLYSKQLNKAFQSTEPNLYVSAVFFPNLYLRGACIVKKINRDSFTNL